IQQHVFKVYFQFFNAARIALWNDRTLSQVQGSAVPSYLDVVPVAVTLPPEVLLLIFADTCTDECRKGCSFSLMCESFYYLCRITGLD
ncbi:hypothetical protein, partial [Klebsiella pneumoniae]